MRETARPTMAIFSRRVLSFLVNQRGRFLRVAKSASLIRCPSSVVLKPVKPADGGNKADSAL